MTTFGHWSIRELMTTSEVARAFGVDPKTVVRWSKTGKIAHIYTPGGHRRYPAEQVNYLIAGGTPACDGLHRSDLTGHTITVEPMTAAMVDRSGIDRAHVLKRAVVERSNGQFVKIVHHEDEWAPGTDPRQLARLIARDYGATYGGAL